MDMRTARADDDGMHALFAVDDATVRLLQLAGARPDRPLAALVPLDGNGFDRMAAIDRLLRALLGMAVPRDGRLTSQQKRRQRHMLQATDGRLNGATYREIAGVIFGVDRVASEPWKTSALRDATTALVRYGLAMIAGGYRTLLRHRRRS
ncbi:DUF2285 domain-containing protein [Bosea sp. NPDC055332]